jgi:hypothetical protein
MEEWTDPKNTNPHKLREKYHAQSDKLKLPRVKADSTITNRKMVSSLFQPILIGVFSRYQVQTLCHIHWQINQHR